MWTFLGSCISIYISIYSISIYISIYVYIEKRTERSRVLLPKIETFSRSFPFFAKECCILYVLFRSVEKNGKEWNVLLGLISHQKLEKRTEKNGMFLLKNGKERNVPNGKERVAQPWHLMTTILYGMTDQ